MNDALQILGVIVLATFLAFSLTGKSPREVVSSAWEQSQSQEPETSPILLSLKGYVPPTWLGQNTALQTNTDTVIDTHSETNSGNVFVSNTRIDKERSDFKNSATNDVDNGAIIIAAKNTNPTSLTASITQANISNTANNGVSSLSLLVVVIMLMILVFLVHLTSRKKKQLGYYNRTNPRVRPRHVPTQQNYQYSQRQYQHR